MDLEMKEIFIEKTLNELNAPPYLYLKCYQSVELICKLYNVLSKPNPTLDKIYECIGRESYEEVKDYSTLSGPNLFVKKIMLNRNRVITFNKYPFNIELLKDFKELSFEKNVSFFVGDNGIGKSTLIEALAVKLELNAEGGTQNFMFSTNDTHSNLYEYLNIVTDIIKPKNKFFFRAETFYNLATEIDELDKIPSRSTRVIDSYGGKSLHNSSHGESFMQLIENKFTEKGLYILDEPEAALSPFNQMKLLVIIDRLAKEGSQFIISTHSPILISYRDGIVYNLNDQFKIINYKETETFNIYRKFINDPEGMQKELFD